MLNDPSASASPNATDPNPGSAIASQSCGAINTSTSGPKQVTCNATDTAGNAATPVVLDYVVKKFGPPASIAMLKGTGQSAFTGRRFPTPLVAQVLDAFGNPRPKVEVRFRRPGKGAFAKLSAKRDTTDANGKASVKATANLNVGKYNVRASVVNVPAGTAVFALTNVKAPFFSDNFSHGWRSWNKNGLATIAGGVGQPKPSALLRATGGKTYANHGLGKVYKRACATAAFRLNSIGGEAVSILRLRNSKVDGVARLSVDTTRELFIRNDARGGVKPSGVFVALGNWYQLELCTTSGTGGSIQAYVGGSQIVGWQQNLGKKRIGMIQLVENDTKVFSMNLDQIVVDGKPGEPTVS